MIKYKYRLKENEDEKPEPETTGGGGGNREKIDYDIFLTPKGKTLDDVIKALKDIENYGTYVSNMRSKASVEDAIVKHFGPTVPVKKKQLEKEMGHPFPMKTKQAIDDLVKSLTSRPTLLSYHKEGNELVFPKNENPTKDLTKKIIKTVMKNATIDYSLKDKENLGETKLINILKTAINESMYDTLGGEHPYTDAEMRKNIVEPNLGSNYDAYIMFINDEYNFLKDDLVTDFNFPTGWKKLYQSSNYQGEAYLSPQGNVIKASILSGGGIVGAIYVTKDMNEDYNSKWKNYLNEYEGEGEDSSIDDENLGYYSEKDEETGESWYDIAEQLEEILIDCNLFDPEYDSQNRVAAIASDLKEDERRSNGGNIPDHIFKKIKDLGKLLDSKERGVN